MSSCCKVHTARKHTPSPQPGVKLAACSQEIGELVNMCQVVSQYLQMLLVSG